MTPSIPPPVDTPAQARAWLVLIVLLGIAGAVLWFVRARRSAGITPGAPRVLHWLRALVPGSVDAPLRVVHSVRLTSRASVHVLRWDGREWLVGCTDHALTAIAQRSPPAEEEGGPHGTRASRSDSDPPAAPASGAAGREP